MPRLGVNIDHIATLREVRKAVYPDPVDAVPILEKCGVEQITCHLREDRRHIQDRDLIRLIALKSLPINLEMALTDEMVRIAARLKPATVTLVPEKRQELTTEGGLNLNKGFQKLEAVVGRLKEAQIRVSLFIDPDSHQVDLASKLMTDAIELHTGTYCEAFGKAREKKEFERIKKATAHAKKNGLQVFAGHGLNPRNLSPLVQISEIEEYNIGHSIIARAVFYWSGGGGYGD